jgi:uncharacterized protein YbgA (DUF1722 family)
LCCMCKQARLHAHIFAFHKTNWLLHMCTSAAEGYKSAGTLVNKAYSYRALLRLREVMRQPVVASCSFCASPAPLLS